MGITLRHTASSVNVKERLDFSCAIFTAAGDLVVNAPHIPVHLGAMSETVKRILADNPQLRPGDVLVTNDPYRGGSHLPDVTVITPIHDRATGQLSFLYGQPGPSCRNRRNRARLDAARSAESGRGRGRDSQFPFIHRRPSRIGTSWESCSPPVRFPAATSPRIWPTSRPKWPPIGAVSATWTNWSSAIPGPWSSAYMEHIQHAAAEKVSRALTPLCPRRAASSTIWTMARRSPWRLIWRGGRATFDFTGTGPVLPGNLNANRAITTAAVMYVLRTFVDEDIPLNQGVLRPIEIRLPECLLNPPEADAGRRLCGGGRRQRRDVAAGGRRAAGRAWNWPRPAKAR